MRLLALTVVGVVGVAALLELAPWTAGPPETGVRLLLERPEGLEWLDVDTGTRTPVPTEPDHEWTDPQVVSDGVVVRYPSGDSVLADRVVSYRAGDAPHEVGEADDLALVTGSALWLVVDSAGSTAGGAALTTAFGSWRSRVFSLPKSLDVVGAVDDSLVVTRGEFRYRRLMLWDVRASAPIRTFDLVVGVRDVLGDRVMFTPGCLASGCSSAVVDVTTGKTTDVKVPVDYAESSAPTLTNDGVAMVVIDRAGVARIAVGSPNALQVVDVDGLDPARGGDVLPTTSGWLVVSTADGDVTLWRDGLEGGALPQVELAPDDRVVGVSG